MGIMNKVLVYAQQLLPYSQTFIREQVRSMQVWRPVLVGERVADSGLSLDDLDVRLLRPEHEGAARYIKRQVLRLLRLPDLQVLQSLKNERAGLLHIHFGTGAVQVWPLARALGIPVLVTLHGYDINTHRGWWESGRGGVEFIRYPRQLLEMARSPLVGFIAVSQAIRQRAIEFGLPAEKISVYSIGVDIERFCPGPTPLSKRPPQVLFVGRQVEKKGCELLIRAFVHVQQRIHDARLVVVGDGPLLARHKALAFALGVRAEFLGAIPVSAVIEEMAKTQVFCLPSITAKNGDAEGLPISILEAQSCGLPVVITKSGGSDEAIEEGVTGFCVESFSSARLAASLELLLQDAALLESMGANARRLVERKFALSQCTSRLEEFFSNYVESLPSG